MEEEAKQRAGTMDYFFLSVFFMLCFFVFFLLAEFFRFKSNRREEKV
jgi:hypothetical protein